MKNIRVMFATALAALLISACSVIAPLTEANKELSNGIKSYDDGDYQAALVSLKKAQDLGLSAKSDQVRAHKYLAFIHCVSGREKQCRDEFRKALEIDPAFDLQPAEAGHPVWGPVFRGEKAKLTK